MQNWVCFGNDLWNVKGHQGLKLNSKGKSQKPEHSGANLIWNRQMNKNKEFDVIPLNIFQIGLVNVSYVSYTFFNTFYNAYLEFITVTNKIMLSWYPDKEQGPSL